MLLHISSVITATMESSCSPLPATEAYDVPRLFVILGRSSCPKVTSHIDSRTSPYHVSGSLAKKAASRSAPLASLKFPPVTAISHSSTRAKDWDDVITAHSEDPFARTWTLPSKRTGKHTFKAQDGVKLKGKGKEPVDASVKVHLFVQLYANLLTCLT